MSLNSKYGMSTEHTTKAFGELFSTIDFNLNDELTNENFRNQGKKTKVGTLEISNKSFNVNLHDLYQIMETCQNAINTIYKKYQLGLMRR